MAALDPVLLKDQAPLVDHLPLRAIQLALHLLDQVAPRVELVRRAVQVLLAVELVRRVLERRVALLLVRRVQEQLVAQRWLFKPVSLASNTRRVQ